MRVHLKAGCLLMVVAGVSGVLAAVASATPLVASLIAIGVGALGYLLVLGWEHHRKGDVSALPTAVPAHGIFIAARRLRNNGRIVADGLGASVEIVSDDLRNKGSIAATQRGPVRRFDRASRLRELRDLVESGRQAGVQAEICGLRAMNKLVSTPILMAARELDVKRAEDHLIAWVRRFDSSEGLGTAALIDAGSFNGPVPEWAAPFRSAWGKWNRRCQWLSQEIAK